MGKKDHESSVIDNLMELDKFYTSKLSVAATKESPLGHYRGHMKALEYSCHGVFWITGCIIGLFFTDDIKKLAFLFNLIIALILDIVVVGVLKAMIARPRPENNQSSDMLMTFSVDKMSCPSGHTSRAVMLTYLFVSSTPSMSLLHLILIAWCVSTCASRIFLGRHHVGDVLVGVVQGYTEYLIMDYIWAGPERAKWYLDFIQDSSVIDDL